MSRNRVVVTGLGVVSAIGRNVHEFSQGLRRGKDGLSRIEGFAVRGMRSTHAGEIKGELRTEVPISGFHKPVDRASLLLLLALREAVADSGLVITEEESLDVGIFMGTCGGGYLSGLEYLSKLEERKSGLGNLLLDLPLHAGASRGASEFRIHGGINIVSNACASSAIAIAFGFERIRSGRAAAMIVGGYEALSPLNGAGFGIMRNSSLSNRIRPFDKNRDGMLLGEGAAVLVLESLARHQERKSKAVAEILGYGISSDTYHITAPDPTGRGAAMALSTALQDAGITAEDVDYINAHGTGTIYNDRMECQAVRRVFRERARSIPMSSTKSMIGHTLGASGAIEMVATIVGMRDGFLPPTINFETPDPHCGIDCVPNVARPAEIRRLVSNSFGFGGTNCSLVIGRFCIPAGT